MAKRRVTTHSKVASALCAHVYVFACTPRRAHPGALPMSAPTWAARGVFSASCFVSERALPRAAEVLPEAVGAHPRFCVSAAEERAGAFREERSGRKRGGCCQPGYVTAMWVVVYPLKQTRTNTPTWPQSRLFLYAHDCQRTPSEIPCSKGEF